MKQSKYLLVMALVLVIGGVVLALGAAPTLARNQTTTSDLYYFDPFPVYGEQVEGGSARLSTNQEGARLQLQTVNLTPGDAVTIWWVIFNNPEACAGYPDEACTLDDIMGNTAGVGGEIGYATGHVIGGDGRGNFAAHLPVGPVPNAWFGNGFDNPTGAEIHVVVHTHGPAIPGLVDEMISTFRAGCQDDWFINENHPAHGDGTPGPNECVDLQFGVFRQ